MAGDELVQVGIVDQRAIADVDSRDFTAPQQFAHLRQADRYAAAAGDFGSARKRPTM
jgi:hypothetical protein